MCRSSAAESQPALRSDPALMDAVRMISSRPTMTDGYRIEHGSDVMLGSSGLRPFGRVGDGATPQ